MSTMQYLQRTKHREVSFPGTELAYASNKEREGERRSNWTVVKVCKNDLGGYYVGIGHLTSIHGKKDFLIAEPTKSIKESIMIVRQNAPELEDEIVRQLNAHSERHTPVHQR